VFRPVAITGLISAGVVEVQKGEELHIMINVRDHFSMVHMIR
jgi:hypothetical protein